MSILLVLAVSLSVGGFPTVTMCLSKMVEKCKRRVLKINYMYEFCHKCGREFAINEIHWFGTLSIKKSGLESVFCSSADERFAK